MKFTVLGATGRTGQELLRQAVRAGHYAVAVVRDPHKLDELRKELSEEEAKRLEVMEGSVFSADDLEKLFTGSDAVISTLGFPAPFKTITEYSCCTKIIVEALKRISLKKLILMHSWYTDPNSRSECSFLPRLFVLPFIRQHLDDMFCAETYLRSVAASHVEWTIVGSPRLTDGPATDSEIKTSLGYFVKDGATTMSRADVARYLLKVATEGFQKGAVVAISV